MSKKYFEIKERFFSLNNKGAQSYLHKSFCYFFKNCFNTVLIRFETFKEYSIVKDLDIST